MTRFRFHAARWLCVSIMLAGCANAPTSLATAPCATPLPDEDWAVANPEAAGFDAGALCTAFTKAANGKANIHAIVVERNGRLVAELYRTAPDYPLSALYGLWYPFKSSTHFDAQTLHDVRSVSKSVVGLLLGIAKDKGRIADLDAPVLSFYPELTDLKSKEQGSISFKHLLTMSSGLAWDEWGRSALGSDEMRLFWKTSQARFVFDRPMAAVPGSKFNYNGGGTAVLADILVRVTGRPLEQIAREELFQPLGITHWEWVTDFRERPLAFAGLRLRPRDMLKIGRLINNGGRWHGRQLVSQQWIAESLRPHISTGISLLAVADEDVGYGYQWWTGRVAWRGRELGWAAAVGRGGQRIFVVPELDMTVVITAGEYDSAEIQRTVNGIFSAILTATQEGRANAARSNIPSDSREKPRRPVN